MGKKEYSWANGNIPEIEPHSLAKHRILKEYVERYIAILMSNRKREYMHLTIIDGFAGGGVYKIPNTNELADGSPFVIVNAANRAVSSLTEGRTKPPKVDINYIFCEKKIENFSTLQSLLTEREIERYPVLTLHGAFEEHLDSIISRIKARKGRVHRAIFILDQYGYSAVSALTLQKIFRELPHAEVFMTMAVGWILAHKPNAEPALQEVCRALSANDPMIRSLLVGHITEEQLSERTPQGRDAMRAVQKLLLSIFTKNVGALCYTPFFIVSRESNRAYWFLHLANSPRANDVVKELHWDVENHFIHYGGPGIDMLGYDPARRHKEYQQSFDFDRSAEQRALDALAEQLPARVCSQFSSGVPFDKLYESLCNETPASKALLRKAVNELCSAHELSKKGANGEQRSNSTEVKNNDIIYLPRQIRLDFSASH